MKSKSRKLRLSKETLRHLDSRQLGKVAGGRPHTLRVCSLDGTVTCEPSVECTQDMVCVTSQDEPCTNTSLAC